MFLVLTGAALPQGAPDQGPDRAAIRQAVLDYAEGYYDHASERMERAVSPLLTKRALMVRPGVAPFLLQMNAEMLIEATRGTAPRPAAAERRLEVEVLDVEGNLASARVFSVQFNDYIHLVKRDGKWQLVNVLWHPPLATPPAATGNAAIEEAARNFAASLVGGDGQRALAMLSPVAAVRTLVSAPSGALIIRDVNPETIAGAITAGQMPKSATPLTVKVLSVDGDIASAKLGAGSAAIYVHLGQLNGKWVVVNTLGAAGGR
jgi:hypothetical protein